MKSISAGKVYTLKELEKDFGFKRLFRNFAGLELFKKEERLYLFKPQGQNSFAPFLSKDYADRGQGMASQSA